MLVYNDGSKAYLDKLYKTERAARNAAIRARAKLEIGGIRVAAIHTAPARISVTGFSAPVRRGLYPSDFNHSKDAEIENHF